MYEIWQAVKVESQVMISLSKTLWKYSSILNKKLRARMQNTMSYEQALFLEYTNSKKSYFGISGSEKKRMDTQLRTGTFTFNDINIRDPDLGLDTGASSEILSTISTWGDYKITKEDTVKETLWEMSGFCIGGPAVNPGTDKILSADIGVEFDMNNPHYPLIISGEKRPFTPQYDSIKGGYTTDYGCLIRIKNPHFPKKKNKDIIAMGCKAFGTIAASRILTNPNTKLLKEINNDFMDENFIYVIEVKIDIDSGLITKVTPELATNIPR